jgi:UDPglucose 6-dehydrogenase
MQIFLQNLKEFRSPDFEEIKSQLITPIIFDGRNQHGVFNLNDKCFEYYQIGKK